MRSERADERTPFVRRPCYGAQRRGRDPEPVGEQDRATTPSLVQYRGKGVGRTGGSHRISPRKDAAKAHERGS